MVILSLKLVLRAGLEPTTLCLEGRCSIQLSYQSTFKRAVFPGGVWARAQSKEPGSKRDGPFEVTEGTQFVIIYHVYLKNQCKESVFPVFSPTRTECADPVLCCAKARGEEFVASLGSLSLLGRRAAHDRLRYRGAHLTV